MSAELRADSFKVDGDDLDSAVVFEAEAGESESGGWLKLYLTDRGTWVCEENGPAGCAPVRRPLDPAEAHHWLLAQVDPVRGGDPRRSQIVELVESVPFWWHSIDLGDALVTPGYKTPEILAAELESMRLPDLTGASVLDVGAFDGFFAFEAERRGARRVVALDHFCWCQDLVRSKPFGLSVRDGSRARAEFPEIEANFAAGHTPGKRAFDAAHAALGSRVEAQVADFMTADLDALGAFDVVLFLGVLYHMENPVEAMRRLARVTRDVAIIETEAIAIAGQEERRLCEFYTGDELQHDPTNWWAPNARAVEGLALEAGFRRVVALNPPDPAQLAPGELHHYRGFFHAFR